MVAMKVWSSSRDALGLPTENGPSPRTVPATAKPLSSAITVTASR